MNLKYFDKHAQKTHPENFVPGEIYFLQTKTLHLKLQFVDLFSQYGRLILKFKRKLKTFDEPYRINWLDIERWCAYPPGYEYLATHEIVDENRQCSKCGLFLVDIHANRIRCKNE